MIPITAQARTSSASASASLSSPRADARRQPRRDALGGGHVMGAEALGIDEFGLVDDAIDFLVVGDEAQISGQRARLDVERVAGALDRRGDRVADPRRHVAHQRREHRVLAVEISVEGAERDLARGS